MYIYIYIHTWVYIHFSRPVYASRDERTTQTCLLYSSLYKGRNSLEMPMDTCSVRSPRSYETAARVLPRPAIAHSHPMWVFRMWCFRMWCFKLPCSKPLTHISLRCEVRTLSVLEGQSTITFKPHILQHHIPELLTSASL